jgi:hypothetical protein
MKSFEPKVRRSRQPVLYLAVAIAAVAGVIVGLVYLTPPGKAARRVHSALRAGQYEQALKVYEASLQPPGRDPLRGLGRRIARREIQATGRSLRVTPGKRAQAYVAIQMVKTGPWPDSWPEARLQRSVSALVSRGKYAQVLDTCDQALKQSTQASKDVPASDSSDGASPADPLEEQDPSFEPLPPGEQDADDVPAPADTPLARPRTVQLFGRLMVQRERDEGAGAGTTSTDSRLPYMPEGLADVAAELRTPGRQLAVQARSADDALIALRLMRGTVPKAVSPEEVGAYTAALAVLIASGTDQQIEQAIEAMAANAPLLHLAYQTGADVSSPATSYGGTPYPGPEPGFPEPYPSIFPSLPLLDLITDDNQTAPLLYTLGEAPGYEAVRQAVLRRLYGSPMPERDETLRALIQLVAKPTWQKTVEAAVHGAKLDLMGRQGAARLAALGGPTGRLMSVCLGRDDDQDPVGRQVGSWIVAQGYGPVLRVALQAGDVSASRAGIARLKSIGILSKGDPPAMPSHLAGPSAGEGTETWSASIAQDGGWSYSGGLRVPDAFLVVRSGNHTAFRRLYAGEGAIYYADYQTQTRRAVLIRSSDLAVLWARKFSYTPTVQSRVIADEINDGVYFGDRSRVGRQLDNALAGLLGR